ncbi:MAG TPA: hypothetical protein VJB94_05235 [Candidatus Nanoarchaeia archaeon]|nr:hypothetical protein [Candidatus Nanoarchaeia archaeon]
MKITKLDSTRLSSNFKERKEDFLLKDNKKVLAYFSIITKNSEAFVHNILLKEGKIEHEDFIVNFILNYCKANSISKLTILKNLRSLEGNLKKENLTAFTKSFVKKETQVDLKAKLEELEIKGKVSEQLKKLPL